MFGKQLDDLIGHFQTSQSREKILDLSLAVRDVFVENGSILGMINIERSMAERMDSKGRDENCKSRSIRAVVHTGRTVVRDRE